MTTKQKKSPITKYLQLFGILILLVILPLAALFFSRSGLALNKKIKSEIKLLKDSIPSPDFSLTDYNKITVNKENLKDYLYLVQFAPINCTEDCKKNMDALFELQQSFAVNERKNMVFITHLIDADPAQAKEFIKTHQIDTFNWMVLNTPQSTAADLSKAYRVDANAPHQLSLISDQGYLCDVYDLKNKEDRKNLPIHMTLMVKKQRRDPIEYKPEQDPYKNQ